MSKGIIWEQISSFDFFIKSDLKKILNKNSFQTKLTDLVYNLTYNSPKIQNAIFVKKNLEYTITPQECRRRDITYSGNLYVNLKIKVFGQVYTLNNFSVCKIPIMLQSKNCILSGKNGSFLKSVKECLVDPGGYFIVKGIEKVVLIQEQLTLNRIFIESDSSGYPCATTTTHKNFFRIKNSIVLKNRELFFRHKIFIEDIPLLILFRYFKFESNDDLINMIGKEFEHLLEFSLKENKFIDIVTKKQAISFLSRRIDDRFIKKNDLRFFSSKKGPFQNNNNNELEKFIDENVLGGLDKNFPKSIYDYKKGIFLIVMVKKLFLVMKKPYYYDSKDFYGNKRVELVGDLLGILFDDLFGKVNKEFKKHIELIIGRKKKDQFLFLNESFKSDIISNGVELALITGNWSIKKYRLERSGITQIISRANQLSCLSNLTKIISSCEKKGKGSGPRALHSSQWGLICPSDTPEGESCGLVKNLTLLAHISIKDNFKFIKWLIQNLGVWNITPLSMKFDLKKENVSTIFIDGQFLGFHLYPSKLLYSFRALRRIGFIGQYVSIFWDGALKSIYISTDSGRICRPLIIVCSGKIKLKEKGFFSIKKKVYQWKDFVKVGAIEFLDANEENNASIALTKNKINIETTHMEFSPQAILGISASTIPFCNHNQSPRNTYQCAMGKQSSGAIGFNQNERTDTILSILNYPQKSLVKTKTFNLLGLDKLPCGTNTYICIMSFSGYDLEDSIILNKGSISRGFSRTTLLRKHKILNRDVEFIKKERFFRENFEFREKNNTKSENSNILGKKDLNDKKIQCKIKNNWVIKNILYTNDIYGAHFIKLILRQSRKPEIGDKFSSRHGQKGICGLVCPQENLPFSANGLIPDLIMNPHGFPSRMTIGKLIEIIGGKNSSLRGNFFNGTAFLGKNITEFHEILKNIGFSSDGKELLICGLTGEPLKQEVFCGLVYYQRLKHMVKDKIHARPRGSRSILTRQPTEGRSKGGGLRFGEMERDCVVSFGCTELLKERLMVSSDIFTASFDFYTGLITSGKSDSQSVKLKLPYACKLLFQELHSMNILPKIDLNNKDSFFEEL